MHSTATIDTGSRAKSFPREGTELYQTVKARAERELEWYFANAKASTPSIEASEAVATIQARLATLLAFHRGAIALRYDAKVWPEALTKAVGGFTAMVVRIHCADHPTIGSTEVLEKAAAERLEEVARAKGFVGLCDLWSRAHDRYQEALHAYMEARGTGACIVPWTRIRHRRSPPPTAA
jgi:hypothetical protein